MKAIRIGLCLVVTFAVAAHGAVEPWSEFGVQAAAAALLLLWAGLSLRRGTAELRWSPLFVPLLALGAIALVQYFSGASAYPYLTKIALLKWCAYLVFFFLAVQAVRTVEEARGMVWYLLVLGFAVALFGIVQHLTFNGKLYWFRELRYGGIVFGPYVNRNHFSGLMELLLPLGMAILFVRGVRRDQLPLVGLFTLVPVGALFLAASRGGIVSFVTETMLLAGLVFALPGGRRRMAMVLGFVLLASGLLVWLEADAFLQRFTELAEEITHDRRLSMARDAWRIFREHTWLGTGLGTFGTVHPRYESFYDGKLAVHAHNDYLELLAEMGIFGGLALLGFLLLLFRLALGRVARERLAFALAVRLGALSGCAGLLVHSLVDFNLQLPSHAMLFLLLAAMATSDGPASAGELWSNFR
ncbi:MAG: O-antigen ligase family protein [Acidobacteriia bacterium]|jgi:O-antigen ligase|nr:O-antigen ligase family protein [Terriglobia bacterium]